MKIRIMKRVALMLVASVTFACNTQESEENQSKDNFDRSAMLEHWADDYIIPAYLDYQSKTIALNNTAQLYVNQSSIENYSGLYSNFTAAYKAWQWVSFLEIGPAESSSLRNYTNIYPTSASDIDQAVGNSSYNLSLPSTFNEQGFPAIDYLLSGQGSASASINQFTTNSDYGRYLLALTQRLEDMSTYMVNNWQSSYRSEFVANTGSSATASSNKLINDFVFHFEKELRAGKVGLPAGVFSANTLAQNVEAYYSDTLSKSLFLESISAHTAFYKGMGFKNLQAGSSLEQYLDYLNIADEGEALSTKISSHLAIARQKALQLDPSFAEVAQNSNSDLLQLYDELQKAVVLLKVDMMQALNVRVDYIDADGD